MGAKWGQGPVRAAVTERAKGGDVGKEAARNSRKEGISQITAVYLSEYQKSTFIFFDICGYPYGSVAFCATKFFRQMHLHAAQTYIRHKCRFVSRLHLNTAQMSVLMVFRCPHLPLAFQSVCGPADKWKVSLFLVAPSQAATGYGKNSSFCWHGPLLETIVSRTGDCTLLRQDGQDFSPVPKDFGLRCLEQEAEISLEAHSTFLRAR